MKKILLGIFALSTMVMANEKTEKGTFTNRIGISLGTKVIEDWNDHNSSFEDSIFEDNIGINYKGLYNVTDRFRWGGEIGYDSIGYEIPDSGNDGRIDTFTIGLTGEYDISQRDSYAIYLNSSIGFAFLDYELNQTDSYSLYNVKKADISGKAYSKVGIGMRADNGFGVEAGLKFIFSKLDLNENNNYYTNQSQYHNNYNHKGDANTGFLYLEGTYTF